MASRYGNNRWNRELEVLRERERQRQSEANQQRQTGTANQEDTNAFRAVDYGYRETRRENGKVLQTALGVTLGISLAGGFLYALVKFTDLFTDPTKRNAMVNVESSYMGKMVGGVLREGLGVLDDRQLRIAREKARIEVEKAQQLENIRLAQKEEAAAKARKDAAFKKFYQKPDHCYAPERQSIRVECANEYIRARRTFDESYASN